MMIRALSILELDVIEHRGRVFEVAIISQPECASARRVGDSVSFNELRAGVRGAARAYQRRATNCSEEQQP
jgi:hypothetical protein